MTKKPTLLASLKSILPESYWSWVIPALKHDPLIWDTLSDPQFFNNASKKFSKPEDWTPVQLALIELDCESIESFDKTMLKEAQETLEQHLKVEPPPNQAQMSFELAAHIAISLFERFKNDDWQEIEEALSATFSESSGWYTPFTLLFSMVSDQKKLIELLVANNRSTRLIPLVIHALLSQPIPPTEFQELLQDTLSDFSLTDATRMLGHLNLFRRELTIELANHWLESHPIDPNKANTYTIGDQIQQITEYLLAAEIYALAGHTKKADGFKSRSLIYLQTIQSDVINQLVSETLQRNNLEYSLSVWSRSSASPDFSPPAGLIIKLLKTGRIEDSLTLLPETDGHTQTPIRWLNNVYQALDQEDITQARLFAHQTLNSFTESYQADSVLNERLFGTRTDLLAFLSELIHLLSDLALYKEALKAAQIAADIQADDPQILIQLSKAGRSAAEYEISIQAAEFAVTINPNNPEYRRQLSHSLEAAGQWAKSLPERKVILEHRFAQPDVPAWPTSPDLLSLAFCCLNADQPQQGYEVAQKVIEQDPSNGHAHAILGEALSALGDDDQAMEHFSLATQLAPHKAEPWLSLAKALKRAGHNEKSIETLRTASHAVPDDPSIFFALGKVHLDENSLTQAQTALERAYQLVSQPTSGGSKQISKGGSRKNAETYAQNREQQCEIALAYGETLNHLGHPDQSIKVYESAYQAYPSFPGLAYIYAKALVETGNDGLALAPLAIAVAAEPNHPQPYLDYARILLAAQEHPEEAVQALETALQMIDAQLADVGQAKDSDDSEENLAASRDLAVAYLAQAQQASGELQSSLHTYSLALETGLAMDEDWKTKLAIGMGQVALKLGEPEVAIAALQDTNRGEIQDTIIAQILSEAYAAISLTQEALFAARTAVHLAPDDIEILAWFANSAVKLGVIAEALPALTSAVELDPQRTDLIIQLGGVYAQMGKEAPASKAYLSVLSSPYALPEHLYSAADGLSDLGDNESAANCLERALELQPLPPLSLILDLAGTYKSAGKTELAVKTIDKGIDLDAENAHLHTFKADLLSELGRHQAAQACLEHALILQPDDPEVHLRIAYVLRKQGDLICAFDHANAALKNLNPESNIVIELGIRGLTAELARATMQESYTHQILMDAPEYDEDALVDQLPKFTDSLFAFHCITAESALERDEEIAAAAALNEAFKINPEHPRGLALQSRMALRQGDRSSAIEIFQTAYNLVQNSDTDQRNSEVSPTAILGIILAAIELYQWGFALDLIEKATSISPHNSYIFLQKTRLFVLQAEFQRLCQTLDIVSHAPGALALSPRTFRTFEEAIQVTSSSLIDDLRVENPSSLIRWRNRGMAAFHPTQEAIQALQDISLQPSDQAALMAAYSQRGDMAAIGKLFHTIKNESNTDSVHHKILAMYALSISTNFQGESIDQALSAIIAAIELNPTEPIYYVTHARLAEIAGDNLASRRAMQTALTFWPDEPRWLAFAAQLALQTDNSTEAVNHFKDAIALEPDHLSHYLDLGKALIKQGHPGQAIVPLKQAVKIAPDQVDAHLALATAQFANRNYTQAVRNAEIAAQIAPDQLPPLLLNAEIALKMDDPGKAKSQAEAALRIKRNDPNALYLQASALEKLGNAEQALTIVEKAIPLSSDPLPLLLYKAKLMSGSGTNLVELQELSVQYPDEPKVLAPLSQALADADQNEESIQAAQQALRRGNGNLTLDEQARLHLLLGTQLRQTGQLDQSIHHLSEAIRVAPDQVETHLELGITQEERRQHGSALETYKQAIKDFPSDPRPFYQAALLLKSGRDYPAAESMLRRAAEMAPDDIKIHRQLAGLVALNLVHNRQAVSSEV
ncbi:MAG: tetratricopeptide repeat protein [Anaerolineales bacterium]